MAHGFISGQSRSVGFAPDFFDVRIVEVDEYSDLYGAFKCGVCGVVNPFVCHGGQFYRDGAYIGLCGIKRTHSVVIHGLVVSEESLLESMLYLGCIGVLGLSVQLPVNGAVNSIVLLAPSEGECKKNDSNR